MGNGIQQALAITSIGLRAIPMRPAPASMSIIGVACVVAVFIGVMSMLIGFKATMKAAGSDDTFVVMRAGATSELLSGLRPIQVNLVRNIEHIAQQGGAPLASAELYVIVDIPTLDRDGTVNVPIRGVQPAAFKLRPNFKLISGRQFVSGQRELLVGKAASENFGGLTIGNSIVFGQESWLIVGIFDNAGSVSESEIWTDVTDLQSTFKRNFFQSIRVKLNSEPSAYEKFQAILDADPRLNLSAKSESEYYAKQSENLIFLIQGIGYPASFIMAIGAIFGAMNTMYSSLEARVKQTATLMTLGFKNLPIALAFMIESVFLAMIGGALACLILYFGFDGYSVSSFNSESFSQVVFKIDVNSEVVFAGMLIALIIGIIAGLLPSIRSANQNIIQALNRS